MSNVGYGKWDVNVRYGTRDVQCEMWNVECGM